MALPNLFKKSASVQGSFLPEDYIARKAEFRANVMALSLFAVVMGAVGAAFALTNNQWRAIRVDRESISTAADQESKRLDELKSLQQQRYQLMQKAETTAALIEKVPRSVLIAELTIRKPEKITVQSLVLKGKRVDPVTATTGAAAAVDQKVKSLSPTVAAPANNAAAAAKPVISAPRFETTMTLSGYASENVLIADYVKALKSCPLITNIELNYIRPTRVKDTEVRQFEIVAEVRTNADAKSVAAAEEAALGMRNKTAEVPTDK